MYSILVARHAQSEWNAQGRWQGLADSGLSDLGRQQARRAVEALGGVSCVVSSDLARARESAAIIADGLGVGPVIVDEGWRERDVGPWQGLTGEEIDQLYPGALAAGRRPPGWESDDSLLQRVFAAVERLDGLNFENGANVVVLSHAGIIYALEKYFGADFERVANLGGRRFASDRCGLRMNERVALVEAEQPMRDGAHEGRAL